MTFQQNVQGALIDRLLTVSGVTANLVAFEGRPFNKPVGTTWYRVEHRPQLPERIGFGGVPEWHHRGLFFVTVTGPSGKGTGAITVIADNIISAMRARPFPSQNGVVVQILSAGRQGVIDAGGEVSAPIQVDYLVFEAG